MTKDRIEVGDVVNVCLVTGDHMSNVEVLDFPHEGENYWVLKYANGGIEYVQTFGTMTLIEKGEKK